VPLPAGCRACRKAKGPAGLANFGIFSSGGTWTAIPASLPNAIEISKTWDAQQTRRSAGSVEPSNLVPT
jgi:hypothetical protein